VVKPLALFFSVLPYGSATPTPPCNALPGVHIPKQGAVASQSTVCSDIGIQLLKDGGNAVDALVGTVFCVGVIGMYHSGIGGGGFLLLRLSDGTYEFVDMRETAPAAAFQDMYKDNENLSIYGGLAR
jgi:gamma-glutamyltranspeptidase/glutathione hydrolase